MNDDELQRRLLESVGEGSPDFWSSVDRSLEEVEAVDGFVTALPSDDPHQRLASGAQSGRSARSFRAILAAAAVLVVGAGGLAAGLLDRSADSVATNQPAAEPDITETAEPDEPSLTAPLDSLPPGTEVCYTNTEGESDRFARAELLNGLALSGYALLSDDELSLAVVERFVGRQTASEDSLAVTVTQFDLTGQSRRNVEWKMTEAALTTEDSTFLRIGCNELPATYNLGNGTDADVDDQRIQALTAGAENNDRSLELRPVDSADSTVLGVSGVDLRPGETIVFRFEAEAGDITSYDITASSPPAAVVLVGPAGLALTVGASASDVPIPHGGTHHLVVSADVGTALSVTVSN